ncbi:MAG TPA: phosphoribosyltransferase family protein [Pseudonocardiaceae bacterium]
MFADRHDAGRRLAEELRHLRDQDPVVVGLPRGGVPVAFEVATVLRAKLDVLVVRKLGVPFQPELAMGAVGEDDVAVLNDDVVRACRVSRQDLASAQRHARAEVARQALRYRRGRPRYSLTGRTVIIVDDGIATGATARAACQIARAQGAGRVVLAVPVVAAGVVRALRPDADDMVWVIAPRRLIGVGAWYADFSQTSDQEVMALLDTAAAAPTDVAAADPVGPRDVRLTAGGVELAGRLDLPDGASGLVIFAHGSGSSRHSPRNRSVATGLNQAGFGTLLFDLLTNDEERTRARVFDIELLAGRLRQVTDEIRGELVSSVRWIGYFGASTGAAAALWAAAEPGAEIAAVVSRGGRPDLAGPRLPAVSAPTLLVVGGHDPIVLDLNRRARAALRCPNRLEIVPDATHLFTEPGALAAVTELAGDWFGHWTAAP